MKVELVALTHFVDYEDNPLFGDGCVVVGGAEDVIEDAGRLCYGGESAGSQEEQARFIGARIAQGHESILEHASATFLIDGISRACMAQLTRHRLSSFSVRSQRYCDESDADYVVPPALIGCDDGDAELLFWATASHAIDVYRQLVDRGVRKEDARFILPEATATKMMMTCNFREWRHVIRLRCDKAAQWEIRAVAMEVLRQLHKVAPAVFADLWGMYGG